MDAAKDDDLSLADILSAKEEENAKLRKALKEKDEKLAQAGEFGNQLLQQNAGLEEMIEDIQNDHTKVVENYEQEKYSLEKKLEVMAKTRSQAEQNLQEEAHRWKKKLCRAEEIASKRHAEELSQIKMKMNDSNKKLQQEKLINSQRSETLELKEKQIAGLQKEIKQLQSNLNDTLSSEVAELTNDNCNLLLRVQEMEANEHELSQVVQQLKEMLECSKKSEDSMRHAKEDAERETSSYYISLERAREECRELQAELDLLKLQPNDPNSRGNSLFAEVEDKRVQAEKRLISMKAQHKCMQSQNERLKHYTLRLKMQISMLLETRSQGTDQEHIRSLEHSLSASRNETGQLIHKLKMLQEKVAKQRTEEHGPPTDPKKDGSAVVQFFKHELKDRNAEIERLTGELRLKEIYLLAEAKKVSGLERQLYERGRELDTSKSLAFKQQVENDRLRMKCGEDVKVKVYQHRYKSEKIRLDSPQKVESGSPDSGENKENRCSPDEPGNSPDTEPKSSVASGLAEKQDLPVDGTNGVLPPRALTEHQACIGPRSASDGEQRQGPLMELCVEDATNAGAPDVPCRDGNQPDSKNNVHGLPDHVKVEDYSQTGLPRVLKPRHCEVRTVDKSKVTTPADCKQQ